MRTKLLSLVLPLLTFLGCDALQNVKPTDAREYKVAYTTRFQDSLRVVDLDGRNDMAIAGTTGSIASIAWFPDGSAIAFCEVVSSGWPDSSIVWKYDIASASTQRLYVFFSAALGGLTFSPDGSYFAAVLSHTVSNNDLIILGSRSHSQNTIRSGENVLWPGQWSPDGSRILICLDSSICTLDADGSNLLQLTHIAGSTFDPSYSPDGSAIVFSSNDGGSQAIWAMQSDGSNLRAISPARYAYQGCPKWSPDGKHIAFLQDDSTHTTQLYRIGSDGLNCVQLTTTAGVHDYLQWTVDGSIVFLTRPSWDLFATDVNGSPPVQVTHINWEVVGDVTRFAVSPIKYVTFAR